MNMKDVGMVEGTESQPAEGGALAKIEALKTQFIGALDELAAEIGGGEGEVAEETAEGEAEMEAPEGDVVPPPAAPDAVPGKKPMFGKKKPGNDITKGLGF